MTEPQQQNAQQQEQAPEVVRPDAIYRTKSNRPIQIRAWRIDTLGAYSEDLIRFIAALSGLGIEAEQGRSNVRPEHITNVVPALKAALAVPEDMFYLEGLDELVNFCKAVWAYNGIGVALGEALAFHMQISGALMERVQILPNPASDSTP